MQSVEITAKSVDEAKAQAAKQLGVEPGDVTVTVLEEVKGLFGKGQVRVRADVAEKPAGKAPSRGKSAKPEPQPEPEPEVEEAEEAPKSERTSRSRRGGKPAKEEPQKESDAPAPVASERSAAREEDESAEATEQDADQLAELVRGLLDEAQLSVTVNIRGFQGRYVNLELDGRDVAFLIGKHGEVLNAMQYLVNIIAGRRYANGIRATLDGNNYRTRREEALTGLANKIADQVAERGEEAVLDALPAFERRIVHKALSDHQRVMTYSEGEEPNRRVVIAPQE